MDIVDTEDLSLQYVFFHVPDLQFYPKKSFHMSHKCTYKVNMGDSNIHSFSETKIHFCYTKI